MENVLETEMFGDPSPPVMNRDVPAIPSVGSDQYVRNCRYWPIAISYGIAVIARRRPTFSDRQNSSGCLTSDIRAFSAYPVHSNWDFEPDAWVALRDRSERGFAAQILNVANRFILEFDLSLLHKKA